MARSASWRSLASALGSARVLTFVLAVGALGSACHPADVPGVPLYPNGATTRLPRAQLAQLFGPIARVDGQEVAGQSGPFDLLPGCHVVELERQMTSDGYALSGGTYWTGQFPSTRYALRMKAGARYVIRREIYMGSDGQSGRMVLSAREEQASGPASALTPAVSDADVTACKDWEATALAR